MPGVFFKAIEDKLAPISDAKNDMQAGKDNNKNKSFVLLKMNHGLYIYIHGLDERSIHSSCTE